MMKSASLPPVEIPPPDTGNLHPLLHEIRHALARLLEEGEPTIIDLRALPLAPGEERRLEEALGEGEVEITLQALGTTRITETRYSGVWRVVHLDANGEVLGKTIEITTVPTLLPAQPGEMARALEELEGALGSEDPGE